MRCNGMIVNDKSRRYGGGVELSIPVSQEHLKKPTEILIQGNPRFKPGHPRIGMRHITAVLIRSIRGKYVHEW